MDILVIYMGKIGKSLLVRPLKFYVSVCVAALLSSYKVVIASKKLPTYTLSRHGENTWLISCSMFNFLHQQVSNFVCLPFATGQ